MEMALFSPTCDLSSEFLWTGKSLASALLLGSMTPSTEGVITWISQQSSYNWFFKLTQFETIFLGFILAQIFVLRWLEILPLNLNKWFDGDPAGRRKRRALLTRDPSLLDADDIGSSMFKLLRKLDDQECILKALCSVESERLSDHSYPKDLRRLLSTLLASGKRANVTALVSAEDRIDEKRNNWTIRTFQLAVLRGQEDHRQNATVCQSQYSACSLSTTEIVDYVDIITKADML